jgi:hypothetical protein
MENQILSEDYRPALKAVQERSIRLSQPEVIEISPKKDSTGKSSAGGIIIAFVGKRGSKALDLVRKSAKDAAAAAKLVEMLQAQSKKIKPSTPKKAIGMMLKEDVFAELRYGGETLVQTLCVPEGAELDIEVFPYNGGSLPAKGFQLVERFVEGSNAALEMVLIKVNPVLTAAEKAALKLVPSTQWAKNVGLACGGCGDSYTAVAIMVVDVAVAVVLAVVGFQPDQLVKKLSAEELSKMSPTATANKLLQIKQDALIKSMKIN